MWKTAFNSKPSKGQSFVMPSETIQGQALSIAQMLERQKNGLPILGSRLQYGDDDQPQMILKDLTDIDEVSNQLALHQMKVDQYKATYDNMVQQRLTEERNALKATATKENERNEVK